MIEKPHPVYAEYIDDRVNGTYRHKVFQIFGREGLSQKYSKFILKIQKIAGSYFIELRESSIKPFLSFNGKFSDKDNYSSFLRIALSQSAPGQHWEGNGTVFHPDGLSDLNLAIASVLETEEWKKMLKNEEWGPLESGIFFN